MDELKKSKIITAVSGVVAVSLLTASICAFTFVPRAQAQGSVEAESEDGSGNTISVEVDPQVYDAFMALVGYGNNPDEVADEAEVSEAELVKNDDTYCIIIDGETHMLDDNSLDIVKTSDGQYVIVDGKLYSLVLPEDDAISDLLTSDDTNDADDTGDMSDIGGQDAVNDSDDENDSNVNDSNVSDDVDSDVTYYHIVWGDTLCEISSKFHISVDELAEYNHIRDVNLIYADSDLRIPSSSDWGTLDD